MTESDTQQLLRTQGTSFDPETIEVMALALDNAIAQLPYPLASRHVQMLAKSILSQAALGERDAIRLTDNALALLKQPR